jgi:hypothetical protein
MVTTTESDDHARQFLELLGYPFRKPQESSDAAA